MSEPPSDQTGLRQEIEKWTGSKVQTLSEICTRNLDKLFKRIVGDYWYITTANWHTEAARIKSSQEDSSIFNRIITEKAAKVAAENPEIIERVISRNISSLLQDQNNLDSIFKTVVQEIEHNSSPDDNKDQKMIGDDWLNFTISQAILKSSEEMKLYFAKLIAGEIRNPGSFSLQAVRCLTLLDESTGTCFQNLCNISLSGIGAQAVVVIWTGIGNPGANKLEEYGASYYQLTDLEQHGLIVGEFNVTHNLDHLWKDKVPFEMAGKKIFISKKKDADKDPNLSDIKTIMFTRAGTEIRKIIALEPNKDYLHKIVDIFGNNNCDIYEIYDEILQDGKPTNYVGRKIVI